MSEKKIFVRRLVLDVLKPYDPELHILSKILLRKCQNIQGINITVYEMDKQTQNVKIIIEGLSLDYEEIADVLIKNNCVVHSLDQVVAGEKIIEDIDTPQN